MYTITLEINQICNFNCTYCYLGKKTGKKMGLETAHQAINIAFINARKHPDRRLWIDFVGGETLLSFPFMKKLVKWSEREAREKEIEIVYSITTNGSIINEEILTWLIMYDVQIKISIDGSREIHDRNRKMMDGSGSYDQVIENLHWFREYEKKTKNRIQAAHVVTQNNYTEILAAVQHLTKELNMKIVDMALDMSVPWKNEELDVLADELDKTINYFIERVNAGEPFVWGTLEDMRKYRNNRHNAEGCGAGLIRIYVRTDGSIYGCAANLSDTGYLGSVKTGFLQLKLEECRKKWRDDVECRSCCIRTRCLTKGCLIKHINVCSENDRLQNLVRCNMEKKKQELWKRYENRMI